MKGMPGKEETLGMAQHGIIPSTLSHTPSFLRDLLQSWHQPDLSASDMGTTLGITPASTPIEDLLLLLPSAQPSTPHQVPPSPQPQPSSSLILPSDLEHLSCSLLRPSFSKHPDLAPSLSI